MKKIKITKRIVIIIIAAILGLLALLYLCGALSQLYRNYADWMKEYTGDILLIGINYDEKKGHECVIEAYDSRSGQ